jgi:hypothetical protein
MQARDFTGHKAEFFTVSGRGPDRVYPSGIHVPQWVCDCACGNQFLVVAAGIRDGWAKSCGCQKFKGAHRNAKMSPPQASWNGLVNRYRQSAKHHGREWALSENAATELMRGNCHYYGSAPASKFNIYVGLNGRGRRKYSVRPDEAWVVYNGIDRVDNAAGYTPANSIACCSTCNYAKRDMPYADFVAWLERITRFRCA